MGGWQPEAAEQGKLRKTEDMFVKARALSIVYAEKHDGTAVMTLMRLSNKLDFSYFIPFTVEDQPELIHYTPVTSRKSLQAIHSNSCTQAHSPDLIRSDTVTRPRSLNLIHHGLGEPRLAYRDC
jgi:hypothetical protein